MIFGGLGHFGLMAVGPAEAGHEAAERWWPQITDERKRQKWDVHKVQVGEGFPAAW